MTKTGLQTVTIDIHGMTLPEAKRHLERTLVSLPEQVGQVTVIHGYQAGQQLQNMVRKTLKCKRISRKLLTMNQGETILVLK